MSKNVVHVVIKFVALALVMQPFFAYAQMNSVNYQIWADSVSVGGNRSTSAGYITEDTIGEAGTGETLNSANYLAGVGLPAIFEEPVMLVSLSNSAISLTPDIKTTTIGSASYTLTVSTNARFGYTAEVVEDGNFRSGASDIDDVVDGSVTMGSEEYGIAVSGDDAAFVDDQAISGTPLVVASRNNWVSDSVLTVTHKASASSLTAVGSYSHSVTYIVVGNF